MAFKTNCPDRSMRRNPRPIDDQHVADSNESGGNSQISSSKLLRRGAWNSLTIIIMMRMVKKHTNGRPMILSTIHCGTNIPRREVGSITNNQANYCLLLKQWDHFGHASKGSYCKDYLLYDPTSLPRITVKHPLMSQQNHLGHQR